MESCGPQALSLPACLTVSVYLWGKASSASTIQSKRASKAVRLNFTVILLPGWLASYTVTGLTMPHNVCLQGYNPPSCLLLMPACFSTIPYYSTLQREANHKSSLDMEYERQCIISGTKWTMSCWNLSPLWLSYQRKGGPWLPFLWYDINVIFFEGSRAKCYSHTKRNVLLFFW